jgi:hypothetical protein
MYTISLWASRHQWYARILIIIGFILLTELALFIGSTLQLLQVTLPMFFFYVAIALFLAVFLIYPDKKYSHRFKNFFWYHKACDTILIVATFLLLTCIGNQPERVLHIATSPAQAAIPSTTIDAKPWIGGEKKVIQPVEKKLSKKALKQALLKKIKQIRNGYKDMSTGGKIALIVLSVVVAIGLFYLVAALSCSLSCSGSEGLATLVLLLGTAVIIFFLIRVIRRIVKGPKEKRVRPAPPTST